MARARYRRAPWPLRLVGWLIGLVLLSVRWLLGLPFRARTARRAADQEALRMARAAALAAGLTPPAKPSLRGLAWRHRKVLHPVWVGWLLVAAAIAVPHLHLEVVLAGAGSLVLAAGAWVWKVGENRRGWAVLAVLACVGWVVAADVTVSLWVLPVLMAGVAVAAGGRAWHFRIRPTEPEPEPDLTDLELVWLVISGTGGPLPGSRISPAGELVDLGMPGWDHLDPRTGVRLGTRARIELAGNQVWKKAASADVRAVIAKHWPSGLDEGQVLVEKWQGHAGWALLTILDAFEDELEALGEVMEFVGDFTFDAETGCYVHAIAAGRSPVEVQEYDQVEGAKSSWFSGLQGTGKSGGLDVNLTETTSKGVVAPLIIDCKDGTSLLDWQPVVEHYIEVDPKEPNQVRRAEAALLGIQAVGSDRRKQLKALRLTDPVTGEDLGAAKCLRVSRELPFIPVIIEEAPQLFRRSKLAADLVQESLELHRVCQIGIRLASQETTATAAFGGNNSIRKLMRAANRIIYRNAKDAGGQAGQSELPVDPSTFPEIVGVGNIIGPKHHSTQLVRTRYVRFPAKWARQADIPPWDDRARAVYAETQRRLLLEDVSAWLVKQPSWTAGEARTALEGRAEADELDAALIVSSGNYEERDGRWWPPEPEPAAAGPGKRSQTEQLRLDVVSFVITEEIGSEAPVKRAAICAQFVGRASEDAIDRALRMAREAGELADAGHGLWGARQGASA